MKIAGNRNLPRKATYRASHTQSYTFTPPPQSQDCVLIRIARESDPTAGQGLYNNLEYYKKS